jgi:hypothetical protein
MSGANAESHGMLMQFFTGRHAMQKDAGNEVWEKKIERWHAMSMQSETKCGAK